MSREDSYSRTVTDRADLSPVRSSRIPSCAPLSNEPDVRNSNIMVGIRCIKGYMSQYVPADNLFRNNTSVNSGSMP